VQNRKTLLSSAESKEGLAKQITVFQEKVSRLEQEKEHWVLELQLLKIKYDNEQQVTTENYPVGSQAVKYEGLCSMFKSFYILDQ
jgi:protein phosphatase 1 regulatory subunit 21